jgi:hypothetical protein
VPVVVHITDEKNAASVLRAGIRLPKEAGAIYLMPMLQSHFISHQWIRELRRRGSRVLAGVYFRLPSTEIVWAGKYHEPHREVPLADAVKELRALSDPLGYEVFVTRKISPSEIERVRSLPQGVGWRYKPHAHGKPLCACPVCLPRGSARSKAIRERLEPEQKLPSLPEVKARLAETPLDEDDVTELLWALRRKHRRADPAFLGGLLATGSVSMQEDVALTLPFFRHPESVRMLRALAMSGSPEVAAAATEGLAQIGRLSEEREVET